jgi:Fic family protein
MPNLETVYRIEPATLEDAPAAVLDVMTELVAETAKLGQALHPKTAASLAGLVRIMNTYYSNLIEGHKTLPRDIERALAAAPSVDAEPPYTTPIEIENAIAGDFGADLSQRSLLQEAVAHVRVQTEVDRMHAEGRLPEPASLDFLRWLHREFYRDASDEVLHIRGAGRSFRMEPGDWRSRPEHDVSVGRHQPPASDRVADFMSYFAERYRFDRLGASGRILAISAAHHRFNYIHPFADGNGRVSRLMSHAMAHAAGIGAHGLWSVSRGLARGLENRRGDYKRMMDEADQPRRGDLDGRGNLSARALSDFCLWFLRVSLDQVKFMGELFDLSTLARRLRRFVDQSEALKSETARLLEEALVRGEFERGDASRITGLPERSARRVLNDVIAAGILASGTPKGPVSLRFPVSAQDILFPRLFAES